MRERVQRPGRRTYGRRLSPQGGGLFRVLLPSPLSLPLSLSVASTLTRNVDSVPISKLPQLVYETQQDIKRSGITYNVVGHAGDGKCLRERNLGFESTDMLAGINPTTGNFHTLLMFRTDEELNTVHGLVRRMVERALALDGTCKSLVPPSALLCLFL